MRASNRFVRLVVWSLAVSMVLAGSTTIMAAPRSAQEPPPNPFPNPTATVIITPSAPATTAPISTPITSATTSPTAATETPTTTTPTTAPTVTVEPTGDPDPSGVPDPTVVADPTTQPETPPSVNAKMNVAVRVLPNPVQVNDQVVIEATITNVGTGTAAAARFINVLPSSLSLIEARPSKRPVYANINDEGEIVVGYENVAPGEVITIEIVALAEFVSGAAGASGNYNTATVSIDKRDAADDVERTEVTVTQANPTQPTPTQPNPTQPNPTQPTSTPRASTPSRLPDTGTSSLPNGLVIVGAGALLVVGAAAHAAARRRNVRQR